MKRRLVLRSEHLTELTDAEMTALAGGQDLPSYHCTGYYLTLNAPCPTVQECIAIRQTPLCPTETH